MSALAAASAALTIGSGPAAHGAAHEVAWLCCSVVITTRADRTLAIWFRVVPPQNAKAHTQPLPQRATSMHDPDAGSGFPLRPKGEAREAIELVAGASPSPGVRNVAGLVGSVICWRSAPIPRLLASAETETSSRSRQTSRQGCRSSCRSSLWCSNALTDTWRCPRCRRHLSPGRY
jgi:hypothetical protein